MSAERHEITWDKDGRRGTSRRADGKKMSWHRLSSTPASSSKAVEPEPDIPAPSESRIPPPPSAS